LYYLFYFGRLIIFYHRFHRLHRKDSLETLNDISFKIIGAAYKVHRRLGPGLLESTYEVCLIYELIRSGLHVENQIALPVIYDEIRLNAGYRIDVLVNKKIILELKSVESILPVHQAQLLTYMRLSGIHLGLLINFNVPNLKEGIKRIINGAI
jgi:GxxExxY protein